MPEYRIYAISKSNRIVLPPEVTNLPDDAAAADRAQEMLDGHHAIEAWNQDRLVVRIVPKELAKEIGVSRRDEAG